MSYEHDLITYINEEIMQGRASDLDAVTPLLELRIIDSVSMAMLATFISEKYGVDVPQELLTPENLQDVRSIATMIEKVVSSPHRAAASK